MSMSVFVVVTQNSHIIYQKMRIYIDNNVSKFQINTSKTHAVIHVFDLGYFYIVYILASKQFF